MQLVFFKQIIINFLYCSQFSCNDAASFCGLKDQLYPDRRAMGFPFDRTYRADTLVDFANLANNMSVSTFIIKHRNQYVNRQ